MGAWGFFRFNQSNLKVQLKKLWKNKMCKCKKQVCERQETSECKREEYIIWPHASKVGQRLNTIRGSNFLYFCTGELADLRPATPGLIYIRSATGEIFCFLICKFIKVAHKHPVSLWWCETGKHPVWPLTLLLSHPPTRGRGQCTHSMGNSSQATSDKPSSMIGSIARLIWRSLLNRTAHKLGGVYRTL